jgi:hypothetical protein
MKAKTFRGWLAEGLDGVAARIIEVLDEAKRFAGSDKIGIKIEEVSVPELKHKWTRLKTSGKMMIGEPAGTEFELDYFRATLDGDQITIFPVVKRMMASGWERESQQHLAKWFDINTLANMSQEDVALLFKIDAIEKTAQFGTDPELLAEIADQANYWKINALLKNKNLPTDIVMKIYYELSDESQKAKAKQHPNFGDATEWALGDW